MHQDVGRSDLGSVTLRNATRLTMDKILNPELLGQFNDVKNTSPTLVVLAAGKGTRFGREPKCIQPIQGVPLARHSINEFRRFSPSPVVCVVGYRHDDVSRALGSDNIYVHSENPTGGTAFAAYEALCVPALQEQDLLLILTMGDRVVPASVYRRLWEGHRSGEREADLTLLTAEYLPPKNRGKGRILAG